MMQIQKIDLSPYWEFFKRRKWWIITPFILIVITGTSYMYTTQKIYKASTLILIEGQRIPEDFVDSTISGNLESRLQTITQQINSRTHLNKIVQRHKLYQNDGSSQNFFAQIGGLLYKLPFISEGEASLNNHDKKDHKYVNVETMRNNIEVKLNEDNKRVIEISFMWKDPHVAANVANAITSQFINQNLKVREEIAMETTEFLSLEVGRLRNKLEEKEKKLETFRMKNLGKLPKQLETNLNFLNQKKDELNNLENRLDMEKQKALMLSNQIRNEPNNKLNNEAEITEMQRTLDMLKSKYTEKHPDVIAMKKQIAAKIEERSNSQNTSVLYSNINNKRITSKRNTLHEQLMQTQDKIKRYEKQIEEVKKQLITYQQRVEDIPKIEVQLKDMQRDYETVKNRYENLLAKKLDAQMSEELEKRQKGEQFKVVDSAIPPTVPFKPDMRKLGILTFLLGLGFGGGMAYLREGLDPAFFTAEDAEGYLERKVLVTLPWENAKE